MYPSACDLVSDLIWVKFIIRDTHIMLLNMHEFREDQHMECHTFLMYVITSYLCMYCKTKLLFESKEHLYKVCVLCYGVHPLEYFHSLHSHSCMVLQRLVLSYNNYE